ncbi:uncharacterized protein LOC124498693 isoform X2 [Dermatophagoides farinae]
MNIMNDNNNTDLVIRKRIINHRNKQIETRIKRQIIIEDGVMISDSGPQVTTKTIEDTRQELEEFDKDGRQTYFAFDDDHIENNVDDKVVIDDDKVVKTCNQPTSSKTYLFGYNDEMMMTKTNKKLDIPKYYYGLNPSK